MNAPSSGLAHLLQQAEKVQPYQEFGLVDQVIGLTIESRGPKGKIGDLCLIETNEFSNAAEDNQYLQAEVVGFKEGKLLLMPLGEMANLSPGCKVFNTGHPFKVSVGPELLGRVVDGLGKPIDDRFPVSNHTQLITSAAPPHPLKRIGIEEPITLGVKSIDGFMTVGKGQRVGIFAGSGVGKSTTLGMIARNTEADMSVIALIGERGREVQDFIDNVLGEEGMRRSIVVVATSEQPALLKIKASLVATTIAEYFRSQGKNVVLMMDSLTRVAMALREVGLAVGEPPASRGYTPSVFAFMPRLVERTGTSEHGSITGLYTVLVEGDDFNEPISDLVRGLLDGHIILSRELAEHNHFPSVDVLASVSRLMINIVNADHRNAAGKIRDLMATYKKSEDLINIGAYVPGSNPKLDLAVKMKEPIDALLKQDVFENVTLDETVEMVLEINKHLK
ncbi:MAG: flagellar protein export ATPase FliI [Vampirovibrionales bacterium]|nr:flagellar protein export ATPase FliI [Vampirovibrionales bacterium]